LNIENEIVAIILMRNLGSLNETRIRVRGLVTLDRFLLPLESFSQLVDSGSPYQEPVYPVGTPKRSAYFIVDAKI
jgi:hypothetical protein